MKLSLSRYFPKGSTYFYSFPAGEDSDFFNDVPAWKEELVAARPLTCSGPNIKVITFAASINLKARKLMNDLKIPLTNEKNIIILPKEIDAGITGRKRNKLIKTVLSKLNFKKSLIMAQPYLCESLKGIYAIPPEVSIWCNDKKHMPEYIPKAFLPKRYKSFSDGKSFFEYATENIPLPCVVKVSSSSSGDGVKICKNYSDIDFSRKKFKNIKGSIFVEEYIDLQYNLGIQFAIPFNKKKEIEIIGINEQLTTKEGEYLGSIIDKNKPFYQADQVGKFIVESILPFIRNKGWYGVGGFDVLFDKSGKFYFIDCNFRMTAMTAYMYMIKNSLIKKSVATFTGSFNGNEEEFRKLIFPLAKNGGRQSMQIITITEHEKHDGYHFNAALLFNNRSEISERAKKLLEKGVKSAVLKRLSRNNFL
jgi:hypothetical protein